MLPNFFKLFNVCIVLPIVLDNLKSHIHYKLFWLSGFNYIQTYFLQ